jgi:hypothetical protein
LGLGATPLTVWRRSQWSVGVTISHAIRHTHYRMHIHLCCEQHVLSLPFLDRQTVSL